MIHMFPYLDSQKKNFLNDKTHLPFRYSAHVTALLLQTEKSHKNLLTTTSASRHIAIRTDAHYLSPKSLPTMHTREVGFQFFLNKDFKYNLT